MGVKVIKLDLIEKENSIVLDIEGNSTFENMIQIKEKILPFIDKIQTLELKTEKIVEVDVSFVQLLSSICRSMKNEEKSITFLKPVSKKVLTIIENLGYNIIDQCLVNFESKVI